MGGRRLSAVMTVGACLLTAGCGSSGAQKGSSALLTGYGATDAAWDSTHTSDSDFEPGSAYDADPSLPKTNGHIGAKYTGVKHTNGHIDGYVFHFRSRPIKAAQVLAVTTQLPGDARVVWFTTRTACAQLLISSRRLLAPGTQEHGKPTAGAVMVEFRSGTGDSYAPKSVDQARFSALRLEPVSSAPGC